MYTFHIPITIYYPEFGKQARFPAQSKNILKCIELATEIEEEERITVKQQRAKTCGYTGLSILHRLYPLYQFRYDQHLVFDEMHVVSLNVVKAAIQALKDQNEEGNDNIEWEEVDRRLDRIPWTPGMFVFCIHHNLTF